MADTGTPIRLFRGDQAPVDWFRTDKTRMDGLFGQGVYLTDDLEVAADYTLKDSPAVAFRVPPEAAQDDRSAIAEYLAHIALEECGLQERLRELRREWEGHWMSSMRGKFASADEADRAFADYERRYFEAVKAEKARYLRRAKEVYRDRKHRLSVVGTTVGERAIVDDTATALVSAFDFPDDYLARTLHGDRPMPDDALEAFREVLLAYNPEGKGDFRDRENGIVSDFDRWLEVYRKDGTRYAWTDGVYGGDGENPSLDVLWNGQHGGFNLLYDTRRQAHLRQALSERGYTGIRYDGGVRLAGTMARGGGGRRHNAYILWDDDYVNACRTETIRFGFDGGKRSLARDDSERHMRAATLGL